MCICCHKVKEFCRCDSPERLFKEGFQSAILRVREVVENYAERIYPKSVWIPIEEKKKIWEAIDELMIQKFGGRIDSVSAEYARWAINNIKEDILRTLQQEE